ncbi:sensor histidine kinase [Melittangium boletus]|uniref:histidine kinase n=1 Tax=Melittangium boletus DSM 14713 TaxID=1294270 RepID=A0A250I8F1_9BACT|nr:sensor histidine kinase [Melittangium boletus]ATB28144.1 two-component sensor histidine kinase [Melittangium boletus DSM 14713]
MRSLSFRSLFLLLMVTPVVVSTAVLGWLSYRSASEVLIQDAIRAVKISAKAREQTLLNRLFRQRERATGFLTVVDRQCSGMPERERRGCFERALSDFTVTEGAATARLVVPEVGLVRVGAPASTEAELRPLPLGQWVRFEPGQAKTQRAYELVVPWGDALLGMRFNAGTLDLLFRDRYGLGESGETFLADAQGFFITQPKYPGHSGESHPIDARPMLECLSGKDSEVLAPDYRGVGVIHAFRYVEEIGGGCIMAHIAQEEAFAPARGLGRRVAQASAALVLLTVGLSFLFARHLSRPVLALTRTASALRAGDFDVAVALEGPRELQTFASTFADMARSLQESSDERARLLARETEARQDAEAQRTLLRLIIEQSGEGILMADARGVLRVFNPAAERYHGVPARELASPEWGRAYGLLSLDGEPLTEEQTPLFRAVRGETIVNARWKVRSPDGLTRTLEGTASPLRQQDGAPAGAVLIIHDVTQQQEAEAERERLLREVEADRTRLVALAGLSRALAESRLSLESILDTTCRQLAERVGDVCTLRLVSEDGQSLEVRAVYARDPDVEARTRELLRAQPRPVNEGLSAQVLSSGTPVLLSPLTEESVERLLQPLPADYQEYLRRLRPSCLAVLPIRAPGRSLGLLMLYRFTPPLYSEDDLILFREIADRTALAIENAELFQRARDAVRIREDLVAVVSHDLRNPISAISMSAAALLKKSPGLEVWQEKSVRRIASAADRALRMIRDLLDSTQARVGDISVEPKPLDFHELARHVVEEVQLAHPERRIIFQAEGEAQGAWDADRIAQVITNLVGNAVQHSPPASPVRVDSRGVDGEVRLSIHNEGVPIPEEELPSLFEPFRRGRRAGGGSGSVGLGLFITRRIVEAHGGSIEVRSREGEGTTFTVRLPRTGRPPPA